ncbi:fibronectin type III domain-containing protein [Portibacter lacus]|uniref:Fibronectin type III domain-containing protein n=1 Tax=Portibacter lacus TaxID=1099794 RepID=A0AA37WGM0_9BACT|nr:hypothetical protein [Portibacter lacus]GLR20038.1 hypothetical protein GCM10007940_46540 [Portibacter lacus]
MVAVELHKKTGDKRWMPVKSFDQNSTEYLDTDVTDGELYSYNLRTIDEDGNETYPEKPLVLEALTPFFIPPVEAAKAEETENGLRLTWQYEEVEYVEFILYKDESQESLSTYKKLQNQYSFEVPGTALNSGQSLWIKAKSKNGRESKLTRLTL